MPVIRIALLSVLLSACSFVPLNPGAEKVTRVTADHVRTCTKLGSTTVSVLDRIGIIPRSPEAIQENLETLAKNNAPGMGGDTIVAEKAPVEGKQTFLIYKCRP